MADLAVKADAQRFADAALTLVGAPFRLHGRSCETGLDCVGVAVAALAMIGRPAAPPDDYRLRGGSLPRFDGWAAECGLAVVPQHGQGGAGDVLLCQAAPQQFHVMIDAGDLLVHAHAGLRRVTAMVPPAPWPVLRRWRLKEKG